MKPASDTQLTPGTLIGGKYRVVRNIAQGGMGAISLCHHEELDQRVAVKTLLPEMLADNDSRSRFVREARAAAKLQSAHVARVTDVGTDPEVGPYLVMEYLEGSDLDQLLSLRGKLPIAEVVDYMLEAIDAIAEAHSLGIGHRDLKPANLFLADRSDGRRALKVLDFGISKVVAGTGQSQVLTGTTTVIGSPVYMAPEQLRESRNVDARADVWSLGVVLYELLTGDRPFEGNSLAVLFVEVLEREPRDVAARRPEIPAGLAAAIMRCLRKDPSARMPNVAELACAIAPFGTGRAASAVQRALTLLEATAPTASTTSPLGQHPTAPRAAAATPPAVVQRPVDVGAGTQSAWHHPAAARAMPSSGARSKILIAALALGLAGITTGSFALYKQRTNRLAAATAAALAAPTQTSAPLAADATSVAPPSTPPVTEPATLPMNAPTNPPAASASAGAVALKSGAAAKPRGKTPKAGAAEPAPSAAPPVDPEGFLGQRH